MKIFRNVYDEQRKKYGRTKKAVTETIRLCRDRNVLKEYLERREREVVSIMMVLYDQEEIMRSYIKSERDDAAQETAQKTAVRLLQYTKMSPEEIARCTQLPLETIQKLQAETTQLA